MGAVLLTGATGFVGREVLSRFLARGDRDVYALVRADDDTDAAGRLPGHERLTAVAGDIERSGLGLSEETAGRLHGEVSTVVHCAASVSFDLPPRGVAPRERGRHPPHGRVRARLPGARAVHLRLDRVRGRRAGAACSGEDELAVGQSFRNPYERSKFEAEVALREEAGDLPLQILRPSIVVGDSTTGRTTSFNVLYGPLRAFARGAIRAIPARSDSPVDIVPVDYVADRVHELATNGPDGTFHLVAGRNATTVGRLLELSSNELERPKPVVLPPRLYRRWLHPLLRRRNPRLRKMEVYFPYFSMRVRFDDRRLGPGPRVERYFHRLVRYAERARWGRG